MTTAAVDPRVRELLIEAARWRLLGRLFECPTTDWHGDVTALAAETDDPELAAAAAIALATATEGAFHSVFGPGGPAPPREASYHDSVELGSLMSELAEYYRVFGYRPPTSEPPDHLAVETGFVAYLCLKESYALATHAGSQAAVASDAASRFRADHLARMAGPVAAVLADSDIEYLSRASALLHARVGDPPRRNVLPVIQEVDDDGDGSEFACCD